MDGIIRELMDRVSPLWGVCGYSEVSGGIISCRAASRLPVGAQSIIVALFPYYLGEDKYKDSNISRYAVVPDYNDMGRDILEAVCVRLREKYSDEKFEPFCGNSPLPEVWTAHKAGLGSIGTNGLLLTEKYGSWVFIGEIVTTLCLENTERQTDLCRGCGKCIKACPTGALSESGFDKSKCLSAISQQKAPLSSEQEELVRSSGSAWGCDECQKACPLNSVASVTTIDEFIRGARFRAERGGDLSGRAYAWRGKGVIERNLKILDDND